MSQIIKCKMCGGSIEATADMTVGKCRYCGSLMTLPRIESEKKARLFNRANDYRLNNEFDKAYDAYKTITEEDEQESEAYWGMILSEYGVEYVEDPQSHKRIPTCHRTQVQSILDNTNYKLALKNSSGERKLLYQEEAEVLDKLQRQIVIMSSKLDPYDVFICYKETDDFTGERTKDSVLAQNIYDELERQGIRAFFSRISLEEHLGENYEPYIYAALKSARVMLMVSTSAEHCDAVWVKNEWARFLRFMEEDDSKVLIPVYQDMDAYEFPNALSKYQAQDMGKVGAIQDLVRGVKKVLGTTRTESRDALIGELIAEKQERESRRRRTKKWAIVVGTLLIAIAAVTFLAKRVIISVNREKELQQEAQKVAGHWLSLDNQFDITLYTDGTCTVNGVSLKWTRDTVADKRIRFYAVDGSSDESLYDGYFSGETIVLNSYSAWRIEGTGLPEKLSGGRAVLAKDRPKKVTTSETDKQKAEASEDDKKAATDNTKAVENDKETALLKMGSYEQDNIPDNGTEPIEWIVLDSEDDRVLVISKYVLECNTFNTEKDPDVSWATCSLRKWLNQEFINNAFNEEEKGRILDTAVSTEANTVQDRVFIFDVSEANQYFEQPSDRMCSPTNYAISKGAQFSPDKREGTSWWLRTMVTHTLASKNGVSFVNPDGTIPKDEGTSVLNYKQGVRPAMWIKSDLSLNENTQ